ncbi:hypothetical protein AB835_05310 [Candidatus Endobugula sertula]|uniref:PilZ domain-containing protein n=1 Tax=Candidatus Endobugula sertula TaxID=62101 RepID=A0A1D2QRE7_9GAMM|nr:hypothetical protein AB835_05310 [Candidatus Endobugula sertula]
MTIVDRQYIRHPSEIPLEYRITETPPYCSMDYINNASGGGLRFHSNSYIAPDKWVHLYIPCNDNYFETDAQVRWCEIIESEKNYDVGVSFCNSNKAFSARMVEQICYIEEYRQKIKKKEGRELSSDQAAAEWIDKYAGDFPENS